jgi:hypothetical protein
MISATMRETSIIIASIDCKGVFEVWLTKRGWAFKKSPAIQPRVAHFKARADPNGLFIAIWLPAVHSITRSHRFRPTVNGYNAGVKQDGLSSF